MNKKGFIVLGMVLLVLLSSQSVFAEDITIGVLCPDFNDQFFNVLYGGIEQYGEENENVEVKLVDATNDAIKQLSQAENFAIQGVDGMILIPVDTVSMDPIMDVANNNDIPMVVVNRYFDGIDKVDSFVGSESIQSGIMEMEYMNENILKGKGNIAIIKGVLGHEAQIKRTEGNMKIIDQYDDMQVVLEGAGDWQRAKAMRLVENWLQKDVKIDAIIANNDEMAIGAIQALKGAGKIDEIDVAGVDATPLALEYLSSGELDVTIFQDAAGQGYTGVETIVKIINGEEVEERVWVPFEVVDAENYKDFMAK